MTEFNFQNTKIKNIATGETVIQINKDMTTKNTQIITGSVTGPVGLVQTFRDFYQNTAHLPDQDVKEKLQDLIGKIEQLHPQLAADDKSKAERKLKQIVEEVAQPKPDGEQLAVSGKGLIEAANTCAALAGPVATSVRALLGLFGVPLP